MADISQPVSNQQRLELLRSASQSMDEGRRDHAVSVLQRLGLPISDPDTTISDELKKLLSSARDPEAHTPRFETLEFLGIRRR